MEHQPLEVQTLYAELLERLAAHEAGRSIGHAAGSFVLKTVKGSDYYYFQHSVPGGDKRQTYIGRRDTALDAVARRHAEARDDIATDQASIERLAALLRAGGALVTDTPSGRVLRALADAGVFALGGVLVGTHAFAVLGNVLGVRWTGALRTQDIDLAVERTLGIALADMDADVPTVLESLEMGFLPVPGLDPSNPSTSYKVRGHGLRVDLLTPSARQSSRPVPLRRFATAAQPLRFLDYLIESPIRAAAIDGGAVGVSVPAPARFALHKLVVAAERPAVMHAKREKDLSQAAQLLEVLLAERPGDVALAVDALRSAGSALTKRASASVRALARTAPAIAKAMEPYEF